MIWYGREVNYTKRILFSILSILAVTGGVTAYTMTQFTDTEKATGQVLGAASLDLQVDGKDEIVPFAVSNLTPGDRKGSPTYQICNVGSVAGKVQMKISNVVSNEGTIIEPETTAGDADSSRLDPDGFTIATSGYGELLDQLVLRFWVDDTPGQRPAAFDWQDTYWEGYPDESSYYSLPVNTDILASKNFVLQPSACGYMGAVATFIDDTNTPYSWITDGVLNNAAMNDTVAFDMEVGLTQLAP